MKFNFENLGYIDEGEIELSDLTIISGANNSGKTYASYSIYGFLKSFKSLVDFSLKPKEIEQLRNEGSLSINLHECTKNISEKLSSASEEFSKRFDDYFSASEDLFKKSKIIFSEKESLVNFDREFNSIARFGKSETLIFDKAPEEPILSIVLENSSNNPTKIPTRIMNNIISDSISDCLFSDSLPSPFVVTSERTGIALFYKELDISKNKIIEHLTEGEGLDMLSLLDSMRSRYAKPIQDNINIIRDYDNINKTKSFIKEDKKYRYVLESLQDLLGGSFKPIDKQVVYRPKKERNRDEVNIPVYIASSSIKSMFLIDLYINCLARKNGILIIDEPELNLHPDNQRKMAGLLARIVNSGIKVIITTHSDYLIREINNRVMLSNDFPDKESIMQKHPKPKLCEQDILKPSQIKAYAMDNHKINAVKVDKYGIQMEIFDSIIDKANNLSDEIYFAMEDASD